MSETDMTEAAADLPAAESAEPTTMREAWEAAKAEIEQQEAVEAPTEEEVSEDAGEVLQEERQGREEEVTDEPEDTLEDEAEREFPLIPKDWSEEEQAAFQQLLDSEDEDMQLAAGVFIERYNNLKKGFHKKSQEFAEKTKELTAINQVFAPFEQTMQHNGIDKARYMQNMVAWEQALRQKPVEAVKEIMKTFGVKESQIVDEYSEFDFSAESDNNNEVAALKAELQQLKAQVANQPMQEQLRAFENATDAEGKLAHPHFKEVAPVMGALIQAGKAETLEQAYAKAIRIEGVEEQAIDDSAENLERLRRKVAQSKRAKKTAKSSSGAPDYSQMDIREELAARLKQAN